MLCVEKGLVGRFGATRGIEVLHDLDLEVKPWGLLAAQIVVLMLGDCWENFVASPACQLCICFEYSTILGYLGSCYVLFGSSSTERYRGFVDGPMVPTSNVSNVLRKWPQELVAICGSVGSGRLGGK